MAEDGEEEDHCRRAVNVAEGAWPAEEIDDGRGPAGIGEHHHHAGEHQGEHRQRQRPVVQAPLPAEAAEGLAAVMPDALGAHAEALAVHDHPLVRARLEFAPEPEHGVAVEEDESEDDDAHHHRAQPPQLGVAFEVADVGVGAELHELRARILVALAAGLEPVLLRYQGCRVVHPVRVVGVVAVLALGHLLVPQPGELAVGGGLVAAHFPGVAGAALLHDHAVGRELVHLGYPVSRVAVHAGGALSFPGRHQAGPMDGMAVLLEFLLVTLAAGLG